jgi:hypothetical protein
MIWEVGDANVSADVHGRGVGASGECASGECASGGCASGEYANASAI